MKNISDKKVGELRPEYDFDYSKAKPNRFAGKMEDRVVVLLDPDIAEVFTTPDSVNEALRALIPTMPKNFYRKSKQAPSAAVKDE